MFGCLKGLGYLKLKFHWSKNLFPLLKFSYDCQTCLALSHSITKITFESWNLLFVAQNSAEHGSGDWRCSWHFRCTKLFCWDLLACWNGDSIQTLSWVSRKEAPDNYTLWSLLHFLLYQFLILEFSFVQMPKHFPLSSIINLITF